jgi:type IV secretion system protein VirD4
MVEMATRFFRFKNPSLRAVTASDDLDFTRMVDEPTALFLSIPEDEAQRLEPISACLIMQLMSALVRRATRSPGRRLPRDFAFYMDEFCNAGVIPKFTKYISTVRSRGIAFLLAVQDFGQLRATYGENGRETILANCTTHIVFPGCGLQETRYYSEKLGKTTVETISRSERNTDAWIATPRSWTHGETHRDLMTPDEIRTMRDGTLLVLIGKLHPMLVDNTPYYRDRDLVVEASMPFSPPASRVTVTPIPPTPPPPVMGLPAPTIASTGQRSGPTVPPLGPKTPPSTDQDDTQFFSPE